ncbi:MAG: hypothetical protein ACSHW0_18845 [Thalassotalea sp.]
MDIISTFEPSQITLVVSLLLHFFMLFVFNVTVEKELREHDDLKAQIEPLHRDNRSSYKNLMSFKYWGITPSLNLIGFIVMFYEYLFLFHLVWALFNYYQA